MAELLIILRGLMPVQLCADWHVCCIVAAVSTGPAHGAASCHPASCHWQGQEVSSTSSSNRSSSSPSLERIVQQQQCNSSSEESGQCRKSCLALMCCGFAIQLDLLSAESETERGCRCSIPSYACATSAELFGQGDAVVTIHLIVFFMDKVVLCSAGSSCSSVTARVLLRCYEVSYHDAFTAARPDAHGIVTVCRPLTSSIQATSPEYANELQPPDQQRP